MALTLNLLSPSILPQPIISRNHRRRRYHHHLLRSTTHLSHKHRTFIAYSSSSKKQTSDAELASELEKMKTHLLEREEAIKKSRELLYSEFCQHLALPEEGVKAIWENMEEEDKWVLVNGFVSQWGANFHPLSARSAKEMLEAYLLQIEVEETKSTTFSPFSLFPGLKKLLGFLQLE